MERRVRLLLDAHALIWFALGDGRLPPRSRAEIAAGENEVLVSAASAWEVATKFRKGKLAQAEYLVVHWTEIVRDLGFSELPVTAMHALRSGLLTFDNPDPFDRMIVAQALIENVAVVSNEEAWDRAGVVRLWS